MGYRLCICCAVFFLSCLAARADEEIWFPTRDDIRIWARLNVPNAPSASQDRYPVVVLCHGMDDNYHAWDEFGIAQALNNNGFATLSVDSRGHGHSTQTLSGKFFLFTGFKQEEYEKFHLDIKAALDWLQGREDIDQKRIGIMGESLGANVAFISCGLYSNIKTAVVISPYQFALTGKGLTGFQPRSVFFICSKEEGRGESREIVEHFFTVTADPKMKKIVDGDYHGQSILLEYPLVKKAIFEWFKENL